MAISSYQFRNQPYWLGFVFAGQAFTISCTKIILPGKSLNIQISTGEHTITHIKDQRIVSQGEQLGIKLIKGPKFTPGTSKIKANTSFYYDASNIQNGIILEEDFIPRFSFSQCGTPIESASFERILQYDTNYILQIKNEGFCSTNVMVNMAFYESGN